MLWCRSASVVSPVVNMSMCLIHEYKYRILPQHHWLASNRHYKWVQIESQSSNRVLLLECAWCKSVFQCHNELATSQCFSVIWEKHEQILDCAVQTHYYVELIGTIKDTPPVVGHLLKVYLCARCLVPFQHDSIESCKIVTQNILVRFWREIISPQWQLHNSSKLELSIQNPVMSSLIH